MDMEEKPKYGKFIPSLHLLVFVSLWFFRDPFHIYASKQKLKLVLITSPPLNKHPDQLRKMCLAAHAVLK